MELLQHSTIRIGAAGVQRGGERFALPAGALDDCNGIDLAVVDGPDGQPAPRLRPRGCLRRFGYLGADVTIGTTPSGFSGSRDYCWVWTDAAGGEFTSAIKTALLTNQDAVVSGWPTGSGGSVKIYRETAGSRPLKLIASIAASTASYTDSGSATTDMPTWSADNGQPLAISLLGSALNVEQMVVFTPLGLSRRMGIFARQSGGTALYYFEAAIDFNEEIAAYGYITAEVDQPCSVVRWKDTLWIACGGTNLMYRRTTTIPSLAAASQPSAPTFAKNATPQASGALSAAVQHVYIAVAENTETGIRSEASAPLTYTAYSSKKNRLDVTVAAGTRVLIYRTSDGGTYYQYLRTETSSGLVEDEAADASLSQDTWKSGDAGAMGGVRYLALHKNTLIGGYDTATPASSARMMWTHPLYPANVPSDPQSSPNYERYIDREDGDELMGHAPFGDAVVVWKRRRVFLLLGDPPGLRYEPVAGSEELGSVASRGVVITPAGAFWLSPVGVVRMAQPGAAPVVVSQALGELLTEPQRRAQLRFDDAVAEDPPALEWDYVQPAPVVNNPVHFRVQLSLAANFGAIAFDYDTETSGERPYFRANHASVAAAGVTAAALSVTRMTLLPPTSGGPTAGATYYARYATKGSGSWGDWVSLPTFAMPHDGPLDDDVNWAKIHWAFGVHWPTREEIWWWLPTGNRDTCDLVLIGCYSGLAAGGPMRWRIDRIPATAACVVPRFNFGGAAGADVLMVATPDGWLMQYPHAGGIDGDTRVTVTDADRYVAGCTFNSGTGVLTATGTAWPTARYGLRGCFAAVRDANGACYAARITANTGTTLTLTFLTGRLPPASGLEVAVGGLPAFAQTHWFGIAGDDEHAAIWRQVILHTGAGRGLLTVTAQTADAQPRAAATPRQRVRAVLVGGDERDSRVPVQLRGGNARMRISEIRAKQNWELAAVGLAVSPGDARR